MDSRISRLLNTYKRNLFGSPKRKALLLYLVTKVREIILTEKPYIQGFSTENTTLLTPSELNMYRRRFLCALYKLAEGLKDKPIVADKVFRFVYHLSLRSAI